MTEKEAWLKIGAKCMNRRRIIFLCHETRHSRVWRAHFPAMREKLALFVPKRLHNDVYPCGDAWWGGVYPLGNKDRATACGFLAAMCDD